MPPRNPHVNPPSHRFEWPPDRGPWGWGSEWKSNSWCVPCRFSGKGNSTCPRCGKPLEHGWPNGSWDLKRSVPWSKKGKRYARNKKYANGGILHKKR